jgi:hypothetical protein
MSKFYFFGHMPARIDPVGRGICQAIALVLFRLGYGVIMYFSFLLF